MASKIHSKLLNAQQRIGRPFVFVNMAISADGKIAPANRKFAPLGGERDHEHLYELRATADAVMCGARTVDTGPVLMGVGGERFRRARLRRDLKESHLRIIVSGAGTLNPEAEVFRVRSSPVLVLTTQRIRNGILKKLEKVADCVRICGESKIDFTETLQWLRKEWGVKRLLCEGGGELNAALIESQLVDEVHLTFCPLILGGRGSPTISDGEGFDTLSSAALFSIHKTTREGDELFAVYRKKQKGR